MITEPAAAGTRTRASTAVLAVAGVLAGVPLLVAAVGPLIASVLRIDPRPGGDALLAPGDGSLLGTDALGRNVLGLALSGGAPVVLLTVGTLMLAYAVGVPIGLAVAATRRHRAAAAVVRSLDVLLVLPSLLILLVLAATDRRGLGWLLLAAALVQLPAVVRLVRGAAAAPARRTALETMAMSGEPWWRIHLVETCRFVAGTVLVDAGTRFVLVLTLLAGANFLGVGLGPDSADWAVVIEQNTSSLFLAPASLLVPAGLLVSLAAGVNLLVDQLIDRRQRTG